MFYQGLECALGSHENPCNIIMGCKNNISISTLRANSPATIDLLILELDLLDAGNHDYVKNIIHEIPGLKILIIANRLQNGKVNERMKSVI